MKMWNAVPFEELYAEPSRNGLNRPKSVRGSGHKMINMGELFAYDRIKNQPMELVPMNDKEISNFGIKPGDLLFARQSLVAEGTGKCSIVLLIPEVTTFESHLIRVRLNRSIADPLFYYYYFSSYIGRGNVQSLVMQVAAAGIRGSELARLPVPHPPLPTQRRIAAVLSAYDDLIENNQRRIAILEEMARSLYREWFVHFRFPGHKGVEIVEQDGVRVPEGWEIKRISDIAFIYRGRSYKSIDLVDQGGLPFLNLKCVGRGGGFRRDGIKRYQGAFKPTQTARKGDIIIAVTDMTQERRLVAHASRVPNIGEECAVVSMDLVKIEPVLNISGYYLYGLLRYSKFSEEVKHYANGANVLHLNPERIEEYKLALPSHFLREQFASFVAPIFELTDDLHLKNENLCRQRDLLLPRLVSGELDVSELEIAGVIEEML